MVDMPRNFIGYGRNVPKVEWPNGARIAVNMVINYEEGSEAGTVEGDPTREVAVEAAYSARPDERDLVGESMFEYGSRVGARRIMRILDKYDATCTIFAAALALERNPEIAQDFSQHGYDMVGHGYRWMSHYGWTEEQEREDIVKGRESIERTTGQRIIGWFNRPLQTPITRRILAEEGFLFDSGSVSDDIPYFEEVAGRKFLIVPYSLHSNDTRYRRGGMFRANDFFEYARDTFELLYEEGATHPRMMSLGLHPRYTGQPGRALGLDRFLAHVRRFPNVWIANRNDIARFWLEKYG